MGQIFVNGTQYAGVLSDAANIRYGGSAGLSATTVQAAIDELASNKIKSDWAETDSTQADYILNKPAIKSGSRSGSIMVGSGYVDDGTNLLAIGSGSATAANLATVSASGNAWFKNGVYVGGSDESTGEQLITASSVASQYIAKTGADDISGDLIPISNNTYALGSSEQLWSQVYASQIQADHGGFNTIQAINYVNTSILQTNQIVLNNAAKITYDSDNERIVFSFD